MNSLPPSRRTRFAVPVSTGLPSADILSSPLRRRAKFAWPVLALVAGTAIFSDGQSARAADVDHVVVSGGGNVSAAGTFSAGGPPGAAPGDLLSYNIAGTAGTVTINASTTIGVIRAQNTGAFTITGGAGTLTLDGTGLTVASPFSIAGQAAIANQSTTANGMTVNSAISIANTDLNIGTTSTGSTLIGGAITATSAQNLNFRANGTGTINDTAAIGVSGSNIAISNLGASSGLTTLSGALGSSVASVTQNSATSALTLSGTNTNFAGSITLTAGTLNIGSATALGGAGSATGTGGTLTIAGGTIDASGGAQTLTTVNAQTWNGDFNFAGTNNLTFGTGAITLGTAAGTSRTVTVGANTLTENGAISNGSTATGLTKAGSGTLVLAGANTYSGATTITGGTLTLNRTGSLSTSSGLTYGGTSTFNMDNTGATGALSQSLGTLTFSAGDGTIKTTRTVAQDEAITFTSLATRTAGATGNFVNGGGTNGAANGFVLGGVTPNTFLDKGLFYGGSAYAWYDNGGFVRAIAYGSDAASPASITATQATLGTLTSATNVQVSGTSITAQTTDALNTLNLAGNAPSVTLANGATLTLNGILKSGNTNNGAINVATGAATVTSSSGELVLRTDLGTDLLAVNAGVTLGGNMAVTKTGAGQVTVNGPASYTGVTTVNAGTLRFDGSGTTTYTGAININSSGTLVLNRASGLGNSNNIVTFDSTGVSATAPGNAATSASVTLQISSGFGSGSISNPITVKGGNFSNAFFNITGSAAPTIASNITLNTGTGSLTAVANGTLTLSGNVGGTGNFIWNNTSTGSVLNVTAGTWSETGNISFTGAGSSVTVGSAVTFNNTGSITNNQTGTNPTTINGKIGSNVTGVTQNSAASTLLLAGANTYTGPTNVTAGTLLVNGSTAAGSAVSVTGAGSMLGGTGTAAGPVTVNAGGTIKPGPTGVAGSTAAVGTLSVGALTLSTSTSGLVFDLNATASYDKLVSSGAVNLALGTFTANIGTGTFTSGDVLTLISGTSLTPFNAYPQGAVVASNGTFSFTADYTTTANAFDLDVTAVPEPSTWLGGVLALVAGSVVGFRRKVRGA